MSITSAPTAKEATLMKRKRYTPKRYTPKKVVRRLRSLTCVARQPPPGMTAIDG
jgi:hypothetical protein